MPYSCGRKFVLPEKAREKGEEKSSPFFIAIFLGNH
jgi:hypothetical protein